MKYLLIIALALVAMFATAKSIPVETLFDEADVLIEETYQPADLEQGAEDNTGVRQKRVTCDLLSVSTPWGSVNHAACAAHCLSLRRGFRGGRCERGVCNCRR